MFKLFSEMLTAALFASLLQNTVFSGALGLSESIRMAKKPKYLIMYGTWVSFFSLSVSTVCYILSRYTEKMMLSGAENYFIYTGVLVAVYLISALFCKYILRADKKYMNSLGLCAFNSLVVALPAINAQSANSPAEVVGTGIGAGAAFIIAVLLINGGMKHINKNPHIPQFFRGTPALFIYASFIALSLSCISGGSLFL